MELYRECIGHGAPVMLIHGVLSDHTFFSGAAKCLSACCKVISYDRRGYGENASADGADYSLDTQAEDAYRVLRSFDDAPACIVGHSAGAHIALALALRYPHAVKKVVLIEPSLAFAADDAKLLADWRSELAQYAARGRLLQIVSSFQRITGAKRSAKPSAPGVQLDRMRKNLRAFACGDLRELNAFTPPEAELRQLDIPVFVAVTQTEPENVFYRTAIHDSAYFGWPLVSLPGTHASLDEAAEPFAEKLCEILQI